MKNIMNVFLLILLNLTSCTSQPKQNSENKITDISKILYDRWYVKSFSYLPVSAISDEEAQMFLEQSIFLKQYLAIVFNDTCASPNYSIKKVHTNTYLQYYRVSKESIGIKSDTIYTIDLTCKTQPKYFNDESPEFNVQIIYDGYKLRIIYNGIVFHLEKEQIIEKKSSSIEGDTVKCKYYKNNRCTGFIIQGTRKAGKPIHVIPKNKDVPMEN